jgi:hypothetical protein
MNNQEDKELIARIRSTSLSGTETDVGELMYQCGFAAGKQQELRNAALPSMRMLMSVAAVLLVGLGLGRWSSNGSPDNDQQAFVQRNSSHEPWVQLTHGENVEAKSSGRSSLIALQSMLLTNDEADFTINDISPMGQSGDVLTASGLKRRSDILN